MTNKSQSRKAPPPIIFILLGLAIFGGTIWFKRNYYPSNPVQSIIQSQSSSESTSQRFSLGERLLIANTTKEKQAGINAFAQKDYQSAIALFQASLAKFPNDPETLIYLNNAQVATASPVKIAIVAPTSSDLNVAEELLRGVAQAQTEFNSKGGNLQVQIIDDRDRPELAKQAANQLVKDASILGIIGHFSSDSSLAAAPIYQENGLVTISPTSTSVSLSEAGDYIFRTVPSDLMAGNSLAEYFLATGKQKAAIVYNSQNNYSKSLKDAFNTNLLGNGGEIAAEIDAIDSNFNAANAVQQAIDNGAEALVLLTTSATIDQTFEIVKFNNRQLTLLGGDDLYSPQILQNGGIDVVDMVVAVPWHIKGNTNPDFAQAATSLWKGNVNWRTAMAYDATQSLIAGMKTNPSRQGMQQTLSNPSFSTTGASGTIKFLPSGDRDRATQLVEVKVDPDSEFGYSFVPVDSNRSLEFSKR
jgi:branched-chain amino acid transport system substrate-binding protein